MGSSRRVLTVGIVSVLESCRRRLVRSRARYTSLGLTLGLLLCVVSSAAGQDASTSTPLTGWVDMHAHPMAHLGFGGKLLHGAPDINIQMSAIPYGNGCMSYAYPIDRIQASFDDRAIHGGWGLNNTCGDELRKRFIRGLEGSLSARSRHAEEGAVGWPVYNSFPAYDDLTHQQMWVGWVRRAYEGGLRVMVSLAVNNRTLAAAVMGPGDTYGDDMSSASLQIEQMKLLVDRHDWMEIAYTPADLRRIVAAGRLAILLGVEIDNIGNMQWQSTVQPSADSASRTFVTNHLQALWDQGVRYIFPIHVVDNKFGGTAVYQNIFNLSNDHQTGAFWNLTCASQGSDITHRFVKAAFDIAWAVIKAKIGYDIFRQPADPPECPSPLPGGHMNSGGLTPLGEFAVNEMMRMGLIIDVDHMSARAVQETLTIAGARGVPINSGHNGPRAPAWGHRNENSRTDDDYRRISALGGLIGLGSGDKATNFVRTYKYVKGLANGDQIAIGTDANGMVLLPGPDPAAQVVYDDSFKSLTDGTRTWNINVDGVANYGLLADYVRSWSSAGMTQAEMQAFFSSAEGFARMWEAVNGKDSTPPSIEATVAGTLGNSGWHVSNVAVDWSVTDPGSAITSRSGCESTTMTADTLSTVLTCTAQSEGGSASRSVTIKRDATPPAIGYAFNPPPDGSGGWHVSAPLVTFSCSDAGSSVASCLADGQTSASVSLGESASAQTVAATATDQAGNVGHGSTSALWVDLSDPMISVTTTPAPNVNGWRNVPVRAEFTCSDAVSGVAACPAPVTLLEGAAQSASGVATDRAGRSASASVSNINVDTTAPTIGYAVNPPPDGSGGWYVSAPTVTFSCSDAGSSVASCLADGQTSASVSLGESASAQTVAATATDQAGNVGHGSTSALRVDLSDPVISVTTTPAPNVNGWRNVPVRAEFACSDAVSGVAACPAPVTLLEGAAQLASGVATDRAGRSASAGVSNINVDTTAPVVAYTGNLGSYSVDQTINIACTAYDRLSGVATSTCAGITGPAYAVGLGSTTRSASATDLAGNTGSGSVSFVVVVTPASLANLITAFAGSEAAAGLIAKVNAIAGAPNANARSGVLRAFNNQIDAKTGAPLTSAHAELLKQLAAALAPAYR